jgi:hypothetical protein
VSGKFSPNQKLIYNAVLRGCKAVIAALKPGVSWKDMHLLANREMLEDLFAGSPLDLVIIYLISLVPHLLIENNFVRITFGQHNQDPI